MRGIRIGCPRASALGVVVAALALGASAAPVARADTVLLKDGRVLTGRVIDRGDTIYVEQALGGIPVPRADVVRIELDEARPDAAREHDVVILSDGRIVRGAVRLSADGGEVIVSLGERGEVRHPRTSVAAIHWRDGRDLTAGAPEAGESELVTRLEQLTDELASTTADGEPDVATRAKARSELIALGLFARGQLETLTGERRERVAPILAELERLETVRRTLPAALEEKIPRLAERLVSEDDQERERAVRAATMEAPNHCGPLLLYMVRTDASPRLRAFCVSQLSALRRFEELAAVLKIPDGRLRLAAAFALGDAGIYAGVSILIDALALDDLDIRRVAATKLREWTRQHFGYRPEGTPEDRTAAIQKWRAWWSEHGVEVVRRSIKESAPSLAGARIEDADRIGAHERWAEAVELLGSLQDTADPLTPERRSMQAERVIRLLSEALELDPSLSTARMSRAVLLFEEMRRLDEARKELLRIIDRADADPGDPEAARKFANYHLGRVAMKERAWRRAAVRFGQALQYDRRFLDAQLGQGDAYFELALEGDPEAAGDAPELRAKKRGDAFKLARASYVNGLTTLAELDDQLVEMVKDMQTNPSKSLQESQVIQSVRRSRKELEQRQARIHFRLGRLAGALGDDGEALKSFEAAARLAPENEEFKGAVAAWRQLVPSK